MAKVFLTGASGFIGRQVLRHLRAAGHEVTVSARPGSLERAGIDVTDVEVVETADLFGEKAGWWGEVLSGQDMLIHSAWYVEPGKYLDSRYALQCAAGSAVMMQGAAKAGVGHVVGIGTCMEYRLPSEKLDIGAPLGPANLYAASKLATYFMLKRRAESAGIDFSWCRLFYLHGEGEPESKLAAYVRSRVRRGQTALLSAGTQVRDYLDVADAGRMIAAIAQTRQTGVINICSGKPITLRAFAVELADEYKSRDLLVFSTDPPPASDPAAVVGVCNWQAVS
jgi:nucleoside-diphosphate-sugar epimerase